MLPPEVRYSLESTSRSSYRNPLNYPDWIRPPKSFRKGVVEEYAARGIGNILYIVGLRAQDGMVA